MSQDGNFFRRMSHGILSPATVQLACGSWEEILVVDRWYSAKGINTQGFLLLPRVPKWPAGHQRKLLLEPADILENQRLSRASSLQESDDNIAPFIFHHKFILDQCIWKHRRPVLRCVHWKYGEFNAILSCEITASTPNCQFGAVYGIHLDRFGVVIHDWSEDCCYYYDCEENKE